MKTAVNVDNSYVLVLQEINCKEHESRNLIAYVYEADGSLIRKIEPDLSPPNFNPIDPDSVVQILEGKVCKLVR